MAKKRIALSIAIGLCIISSITMIVCLSIKSKDYTVADFTPPSFDNTAKNGIPKLNNENWIELCENGMSFSTHILGELTLKDNSADVFFTNDKDNDVWLKLRILNGFGNIIAESGLIKPNQYIETIAFSSKPKDGDRITLKIMAYEPSTYYSKGSVEIETTIIG